MGDGAERWRKLAGEFTRRVEAVPEDGGWDRPAPCEGWVARDVVRHLAGWMPGLFLGSAGLAVPQGNGARLYKNELASGRNIQNTKNPELRFRALLDEDGTRHIELARA